MRSRDVLRLVFNPSGSYIQVSLASILSHQASSSIVARFQGLAPSPHRSLLLHVIPCGCITARPRGGSAIGLTMHTCAVREPFHPAYRT